MKSIICLFSGRLFIPLILYAFTIDKYLNISREYGFLKSSGAQTIVVNNFEITTFDVIINEIMADPSPGVYLPEYEYIELYNRSSSNINLDGWILEVGTKKYELSGLIEAYNYVLLTYKPAAELFKEYGNVLALFSSSASLNNTAQMLVLKDINNEIIDAVFYEDKWYDDKFKAAGGWSLERIDPDNFCACKENWKASESPKGGTPCGINSVNKANPDLIPPFVSAIEIISEKEILIRFNEGIDRAFFKSKMPFKFIDAKNKIISISPSLPFYNSCILEFQNVLEEGVIYQLSIGDRFCDFAGNRPEMPLNLRFGKALKPGYTDIIITEVLFSPFPGCSEFVEIYNNTDSLLNLSDVVIGINYGNPGEVKREHLSNEISLFFPHEYLLISSDPASLFYFYDILYPERLFQMKKMPSLKDEGGCIELSDRSLQLLDRYCYSVKDHYPLLNDYHGVSMERINIDRSPGFLSMWHSASSTAGFATPGYKNSQSAERPPDEKFLNIDPELFTPDNDGKDDLAIISYFIPQEGYTGNIIIFDAKGRKVKQLVNNELLGTSGLYYWDGRDDRGQLSSTGIYLIYFDAFNLRGNRLKDKKVVLLVRP